MASNDLAAAEQLYVDAFFRYLEQEVGYTDVKLVGHNRYAAIGNFMYTHAILLGEIGDVFSLENRWCYTTEEKAKAALARWNGVGEPTGWHRHPGTGRRVSLQPDEIDANGNEVGAVGVAYQRW